MKDNLNLNEIQALVIDMDGVLWQGNTPLPGLVDFFDFLRNLSISFVLATNNASNTPDQYRQKLANFGVTIQPEHVLTSALATAAYLKRQYKVGTPIYVVGQQGLRQAMKEAGFNLLNDASQPVEVVVTGADFALTYQTLKQATLLIRGGARFIGTNGDVTFVSEEGIIPGTGAILAALQAATGVTPTLIGKPERLMFDIAVEKMGSSAEHTAVLGDRLETDILGGQRAGLKTILVTTGIDNEASIPEKGIEPDAIFQGIDELLQYWQNFKSGSSR